MKNLKRNVKGITLIALVISIIVLLILAGISIGMLTGENGILTQAQKAKEQTEKATEEEQRQLTIAEAAMSFETRDYIDKNGDKAIIPAGFAVSQVEGENVIDNGLVVIDSSGNEFVWIPCKTEEYISAQNAVENENWIEFKYLDKTDRKDVDSNENNQYNIALNSITKNKGFYVARYEAGVPEEAPFYVSINSSDLSYMKGGILNRDVTDYVPVSKKGNQVWNIIQQQKARIVSEKMYENNFDVDSYLIDSRSMESYMSKYILFKM